MRVRIIGWSVIAGYRQMRCYAFESHAHNVLCLRPLQVVWDKGIGETFAVCAAFAHCRLCPTYFCSKASCPPWPPQPCRRLLASMSGSRNSSESSNQPLSCLQIPSTRPSSVHLAREANIAHDKKYHRPPNGSTAQQCCWHGMVVMLGLDLSREGNRKK